MVTIGNFDGVHTGHQAILANVKAKAEELDVPTMLICFEPQPQEYFDVYNAPARLTRFREKVELLAEHGIDYVLCVKFDEKARSMTAACFVSVLVEDIGLSLRTFSLARRSAEPSRSLVSSGICALSFHDAVKNAG